MYTIELYEYELTKAYYLSELILELANKNEENFNKLIDVYTLDFDFEEVPLILADKKRLPKSIECKFMVQKLKNKDIGYLYNILMDKLEILNIKL